MYHIRDAPARGNSMFLYNKWENTGNGPGCHSSLPALSVLHEGRSGCSTSSADVQHSGCWKRRTSFPQLHQPAVKFLAKTSRPR